MKASLIAQAILEVCILWNEEPIICNKYTMDNMEVCIEEEAKIEKGRNVKTECYFKEAPQV